MLGIAGWFPAIAEQGRWTRQGLLLVPDVAWEGIALLEPNVLIESGVGRLWYRGGTPPALGYATFDPDDPIGTIAKDAGNPFLGSGAGGYANRIYCPFVTKVGSTYYLYVGDIDAAAHKVFTSSTGDPGDWTLIGTTMSKPTDCTQWGNTFAWNEGGSTWKMLVEAYNSVRAEYDIYAATSSNGTTWTLANSGNPLTTFRQASDTGAGGPEMHLINGRYEVWYHGNAAAPTGPSNIYRAHNSAAATDAWTIVTPKPALAPSGSDYEVDQVADPSIVEWAGASLMFYDADDNGAATAAIKLARFAGTLATLVAGS